jgi:gamma-glutamylcyclotransferase
MNMLYFAYGSNMSLSRLTKRVPSAYPIESGLLYGHKLKFHKVSKDGSGKCDAYKTGNPLDNLQGVLYKIDHAHRQLLDNIEMSGYGYQVKDVTIKTGSDKLVMAFIYYASNIKKDLKPYHWYKHHVIAGAEENELTTEYIDRIRSVESIIDPDTGRSDLQLSIYNKP